MNRKILGLTAALALATGCEFAEKTEWEGPIAQCRTAGGACTENADCCSFGCELGICQENPVLGGVCKTTDDCGYSSATQMLCKSGSCSVPLAPYYCRDDADVCNVGADCCSHHCTGVGGTCVPNAAPVVQMGPAIQEVPRNQPWTMVNDSYDPDAGESLGLAYGWTITPITDPAPPGWSFPDTTSKNPVFTPGTGIASYTAKLDVTDTWGLTSTQSVTLNVVNFAPAVTPAVTTVSNARNVPLTVNMTATDANGDTITCTWSICRPGTATCLTPPAAPVTFDAIPASPQPLSAAFPTGLAGTDEGPWDVALSCSDGLLTTVATTAVEVTNSTPVVIVPATRTFNLGAIPASTPDATTAASATDENGDAIASWTWTVVSVPVGSAIDTADLGLTAATSTATFKPDVAGIYTLDVTACDPPASNSPYVVRSGACGTATVVATVYPYIRPLGHVVTDAAFARGATLARLVAVGPDSTAGALWDYDLIGGGGPVKTPLDGAPNAVTVTPDGGTALVGDDVNAYKVALGAIPTKSTWTSPLSIGDVIALDGTDAYVFPKTQGAGIYFQHLNLSTATFTSTARYGAFGAAVTPAIGNTFLVGDTYNTDLVRLRRQGNTEVFEASDTTYSGARLWAAGNGAHVFSSSGSIYAVPDTVPSISFSELGTTLGITGVVHVDTSPTESVVLALGTGAGSVRRYSSTFALLGTDALPHWGNGGIDRGVEGLFAFVSNDATKAYVVLKTTSTPIEYGLYTYTLP